MLCRPLAGDLVMPSQFRFCRVAGTLGGQRAGFGARRMLRARRHNGPQLRAVLQLDVQEIFGVDTGYPHPVVVGIRNRNSPRTVGVPVWIHGRLPVYAHVPHRSRLRGSPPTKAVFGNTVEVASACCRLRQNSREELMSSFNG